MRVLQLIGTMHIGGAERVVQHLTRNLDRSRFEVDVCCTKSTGTASDELRAEGFRVHDLGARTRFQKHAVPWHLRRLILRQRYDVVHTHDFSTFIDVIAMRLMATPATFVNTCHFGNYPHVPWRALLAQRVAARAVHQIVAVSEAQRRAIVAHLRVPAHKVHTIHNGVLENATAAAAGNREAARSELGIAPEAVVVACIATMTQQKGIPDFIEAARVVTAQHERAQFIVAGGGPMLEEMKTLASSKGLGARMTFLGWRADVSRLLGAFDIVVSASHWEGFAMVILEAMAAGRPIVATDVGDNRVAVIDGETGQVVPPRQPAALAAAIGRLVEDPAKLPAMGQRGLDRFRAHFTVTRMVERYEELYDSLAAS